MKGEEDMERDGKRWEEMGRDGKRWEEMNSVRKSCLAEEVARKV